MVGALIWGRQEHTQTMRLRLGRIGEFRSNPTRLVELAPASSLSGAKGHLVVERKKCLPTIDKCQLPTTSRPKSRLAGHEAAAAPSSSPRVGPVHPGHLDGRTDCRHAARVHLQPSCLVHLSGELQKSPKGQKTREASNDSSLYFFPGQELHSHTHERLRRRRGYRAGGSGRVLTWTLPNNRDKTQFASQFLLFLVPFFSLGCNFGFVLISVFQSRNSPLAAEHDAQTILWPCSSVEEPQPYASGAPVEWVRKGRRRSTPRTESRGE